MKTYLKFGSLIVIILATIVWLAMGGISETKTYYKTIAEMNQLDANGKARRLRVGGNVADSIQHKGREVRFSLVEDKLMMPVVYDGIDPLPDTFKPGAVALVDGKLGADGVFHATKIQAKCASKYEAKPVQAAPSGPRASL